LLPGDYTPQIQGDMTRLGSKLPFREAAEEIWYSHHLHIEEATVRRTTHNHGVAAEVLSRQETEMVERDAPAAKAHPQQLLLSADGAFVHLTSGEWREVKTVAVGEFYTEWNPQSWESQVKTKAISYFSRSYPVRDFERYALAELHRRGLENAHEVVAVNDGAVWIQHFLDYHCSPTTTRILDFAHAAEYVAQAGKAIWEEDSQTFKQWFNAACHRLKHDPPGETIANLRLLRPKAKTDVQAAEIDAAIFYLETRLKMLDYAHFRRRGFPIASGCVESGHKVVFQQRMKGAGMRWAEHHLDPMLALRNLVCNGAWQEGWRQIVLFQQEQQVVKMIQAADARQEQQTEFTEPVTFASLKAAGLLPDEAIAAQSTLPKESRPNRPGPDHPWRNDKWPTREAWRWN